MLGVFRRQRRLNVIHRGDGQLGVDIGGDGQTLPHAGPRVANGGGVESFRINTIVRDQICSMGLFSAMSEGEVSGDRGRKGTKGV